MGDLEGEERAEPRVHRARDLEGRARWMALVLAAALLIAPLAAFMWAAPEWGAQGDPALMGLRALDVGSERTPLTGQPSSGELYVEDLGRRVSHLGPTHFYLMAPAVRLLGADIGMLVVSVLIVGTCLVLSAWAVFRQLGPAAGAVAAVALGLVTFTTGANSLIDPTSSNIAGYPVLCSAVLLWCLLCGDVRLLPLASGVVTFAAHQHLSSLPALSLAVAVGVVGLGVHLTRRGVWRDRQARRGVARWALAAAAVALVLWSPVVLQQVARPPGNLTALVEFALADERPTVGLRQGVRPLGLALGLPPLLGRLHLTGFEMLAPVSGARWLSAGLVVAVLVGLAWRWRPTQPRRAGLVVMAGALAVAGVLNAASMPVGIETTRLVFYHWVFTLSFFVVLSLGLGLLDGLRRVAAMPWAAPLGARAGWLRPAFYGAAALAVAVPALVNPTLDRYSSKLYNAHSIYSRDVIEDLADQVLTSSDRLGGHTILIERGPNALVPLGAGLGLELAERGVDIRYPGSAVWFVDDDHLADLDEVTGGLVLILDEGIGSVEAAAADHPGELVAEVGNLDEYDVDIDAYEQLIATVEAADEVRFGVGDLTTLVGGSGADGVALMAAYLDGLENDPTNWLDDRAGLELLRDYPLVEPRLDPRLIDRMLDSLPPSDTELYSARVYLLDREEVRQFSNPSELEPVPPDS